jgi:polar amino acid transport system permease protein
MPPPGEAPQPAEWDPIVVVPARHPLRALCGALVVGAFVWLGISIARNDNIDFAAIPKYLFNPIVLRGVRLTLVLTITSMVLGIAVGVVAAVCRMSDNVVLRRTASAYIWFFRGTPVLVQLVFWFNIGIAFRQVGLRVPFTDNWLWQRDVNDLVTPLVAAILGLGLNSGAYIAEIVRSGVIAVGYGQVEAAYALGMEPGLAMRRIILPQAVPVAIPPLGNEFIGMLKYSALASVIAVRELLGSVEAIYSTNLKTLELLVVASLWYLALTTAFSIAQQAVERRLARGRSTLARRTRTQRAAAR